MSEVERLVQEGRPRACTTKRGVRLRGKRLAVSAYLNLRRGYIFSIILKYLYVSEIFHAYIL